MVSTGTALGTAGALGNNVRGTLGLWGIFDCVVTGIGELTGRDAARLIDALRGFVGRFILVVHI